MLSIQQQHQRQQRGQQQFQRMPSMAAMLLLIAMAGTHVQAASSRWEPQIAVLCEAGQIYHPQYLSEEGHWTTDLIKKSSSSSGGLTCLRDKLDLLDYCKKVYPNRDITNIVESSHYQKIGGWCHMGAMNLAKCKGSHRWIKPFRCLEGPFQSDALLVPEGCLFDHIHNASRCWPFVRWNQTGAAACQERSMQMRSFAMLLPCGISLFSGVEFVCCPKHTKSEEMRIKKIDLPVLPPPELNSNIESDLESSMDLEDNDSNISNDANVDERFADESDMDDNGADAEGEDGIEEDDDDDVLADDEDVMTADNTAAHGNHPTLNYDSSEDDFDYGSNNEANWHQNSGADSSPINSKYSGKRFNKKDATAAGSLAHAEEDSNAVSKPMLDVQQMPPTTGQPTPDPYFTHFDPHYEHQSYKVSQKEAQQRLEESHREKVTRVMKDWSDLEEKYQDMRLADPKAAQSFKQRMTARFQALEEEGNAEKHQLAAMHQQRVLAHINQRKREAMTCYTQALTEQPPNAHHVEKCLQKLLRALHKDRAHALAHYRHLLNSGGNGGLEAAASERPRTLERLIDIDRAVNQSMTMLKRYPELSNKISQLMCDYILALRSKDDIPGSSLGMSEEAEAAILDKYRVEIERKVAEKERLRLAEKQRKEQRAAEREKLREEQMRLKAQKVDEMLKSEQETSIANSEEARDVVKEVAGSVDSLNPTKTTYNDKDINNESDMEVTQSSRIQTALPTVDDEAVQRAVEDVAAAVAHQQTEPLVQHLMSHDLGHRESGFSLRREYAHGSTHLSKDGRNVYFTLSFAGIALMAAIFVGIAVAKWRTARSPHAQGFIEVDQNTVAHHPVVTEEKSIPNMQINGYENPTYKYFEVKE